MIHSILNKLLEKRGIKNINELDSEEKLTFENWNRVLSKEQLTLEDIKNFCTQQVSIIESKWSDLTMDEAKKKDLIPYHVCYKNILKVVDSPKIQREALEKNLLQLLEK